MENPRNVNKISKYFSLPVLRQAQQLENLREEDAQHKTTLEMVAPQYIFGMEIEVENIPYPAIKAHQYSYWDIVADHSLRNNGVEFVSLPLKAHQFEGALNQLNASLPETADFSPRTSVHVHMNVRDLVIEQIHTLLLVYTAVEEILFNWVGHNRGNNIFCTKITDTEYVKLYKDFSISPKEIVASWNKYTAFNMKPICSKGTVEFRHMYGTKDTATLLTWLNILSKLKSYAKTVPMHHAIKTIHELNSNSLYEMFLTDVFEELTPLLIKTTPDIQKDMQHAVSYVKLATLTKTSPLVRDNTSPRETIPIAENNPILGLYTRNVFTEYQYVTEHQYRTENPEQHRQVGQR